MKTFTAKSEIPEFKDGCAVALGTFDGIHIGHKLIIDTLIEAANGIPTVVYSFSNIPAAFFLKKDLKLICTTEEKKTLMEKRGVDVLILDDFNVQTASETVEDFERFLFEKLNAKMVVVGFNYSYGAQAAGNANTLKTASEKYGARVIIVPAVEYLGEPVSSTRIRKAILESDMELVNKMLGRPFSYDGTVVHGNNVGMGLGFRTANILVPADKFLPHNGVYVTETVVDGRAYRSVTNIGVHPTVKTVSEPQIESHIIGFDGDIYDDRVVVRLLKFIRPEKKFDSLEKLKRQIAADKEFAENYSPAE